MKQLSLQRKLESNTSNVHPMNTAEAFLRSLLVFCYVLQKSLWRFSGFLFLVVFFLPKLITKFNNLQSTIMKCIILGDIRLHCYHKPFLMNDTICRQIAAMNVTRNRWLGNFKIQFAAKLFVSFWLCFSQRWTSSRCWLDCLILRISVVFLCRYKSNWLTLFSSLCVFEICIGISVGIQRFSGDIPGYPMIHVNMDNSKDGLIVFLLPFEWMKNKNFKFC